MLDQLNKIVINLPERTDRIKQFNLEVPKFFKNTDVIHIVDGVKENPVYKGIAQAHMNAISLAKGSGWDKVLIMEDDINFQSKRSRSFADICFNNLPDNWDILLSSVYFTKGLSKFNNCWNQTKEFCGLTFYVVNQKAYDKILSFDKSMHIDRAMVGKLGLKSFVASQFFAIQHSGFSDNQGAKVDYKDKLTLFNVLK